MLARMAHSVALGLPLSPARTRQRILESAAEVFARDGIIGATTREIARSAGVNEVTLFRHFHNKQELLRAVISRVFVDSPEVASREEAQAFGADLRALLRAYVTSYHAQLRKNVPIIRVLIGEIQHCHEREVQVVQGVFRPQRKKFIAQWAAARKHGWVRDSVDLTIIADQLGAMVFVETLRETLPLTRQYSVKKYLEACVETVARAIEPSAAGAKKARPQRTAIARKKAK
jgi:AcrR family transcriptional regulator